MTFEQSWTWRMPQNARPYQFVAILAALAGCTSTNAIDEATHATALSTTESFDANTAVAPITVPEELRHLLDAGLIKQDALFDGRSALIEATILRQAHGWSRFPEIVPNISVDDVGNAQGQLSANFTLFDWGKAGGEKQTLDARLLRARMDLWREHNEFSEELLENLVKAAVAQSRGDLIARHLSTNKAFQALVEDRVTAGVGEAAEIPLVALRVQELIRDGAVERSQREVYLATLTQLSGLERSKLPAIDLEALIKTVDRVPTITVPPSLQIARTDVLISDGLIRTALADRLPSVVLSGVAAVIGGSSSGLSLGLGNKSLTNAVAQTDTKIARAGAVVAMARLQAEEDALIQDNALFSLRQREINARIGAIATQIKVSEQAVKTFDQQFKIGARPITDAVQVHERLYEGERLLIEAKQEYAILLIQRLSKLGALYIQPNIAFGDPLYEQQ